MSIKLACDTEEPPEFGHNLHERDKKSLRLLQLHPNASLPELLAHLPLATLPETDVRPPITSLTRPSSLYIRPSTTSVPTQLQLNFLPEGGDRLTPGSRPDVAPPSYADLLPAFNLDNIEGMTVGARALSKHAHRAEAFWGAVNGSNEAKNQHASLALWRIVIDTVWENVFELPRHLVAYERRNSQGYGLRWVLPDETGVWVFRGMVEPSAPDGHERRWRAAPSESGGETQVRKTGSLDV